ncbi:hypothetical protein RSOLAG22IIIB_12446 [Rhizoctonia solani]|uniref:Uncharacterized protein n=1 Tax=Rhizoctonia solani TaxID=456999 RepID=A0A0K6GEF2_9AGAM|nr:hypothetical protein RSOLAG22IIIB_12446 [Rhizoctonia solani]
MARSSTITLFITALFILLCATRVNTPSHSSLLLRTVEVLPPVYPPLTISGPLSSSRPGYAGTINSNNRGNANGIWAWKLASTNKLTRYHSKVRKHVRSCATRTGRYFQQTFYQLGQPTPERLLGLFPIPAIGKLAALPLSFVRTEKANIPCPTRTLPVDIPLSRITGPSNIPMPTPGHTLSWNLQPVIKVNTGDRVVQRWFIGATIVLIFVSLVGSLLTIPPSAKRVEHWNSAVDDSSYCCGVDSIVLPTTEVVCASTKIFPQTKRHEVSRNAGTRSITMDSSRRLRLLAASPLCARSRPVGETPNPTLSLVLRYILASTPSIMILSYPRLPRRLSFTLDMFYCIRADQSSARSSTKRRAPLLIEWRPVNERREVLPLCTIGQTRIETRASQTAIFPLINQIYARPTNPNPYHNLQTLVLPTKLGVPLPEELPPGLAPHRRLCIEWHASAPTEEQPTGSLDEASKDVESPLWHYGSYRPPNLARYPPEERWRIRNREVRLAQKLQDRQKRKDAKAGLPVKSESFAWLAVWMEMMKHGCIPGGPDKPEDWAVRSIARWKARGKGGAKKVKWADESRRPSSPHDFHITGNMRLALAASIGAAFLKTATAAPEACPDLSSAEYDYIVVGAGAGGGPLAARLALNGYKVLLMDAGHDVFNVNTTVPVYLARSNEDPQMALDYEVQHYPSGQPQVQKWYPRAAALGGCTVHNALIHLRNHDYDLNTLATRFKDSSWSVSRR